LNKLEQVRNPNSKTTTKIDYIKLLELLNLSQGPIQAPRIDISKM
jgi:2-iminobutanoate/2-iminopropanoate deaminase